MDTTSSEIEAHITASLQGGPYAAISLDKLSGGHTNFVYRVLLSKPLEDGSKTVAAKHTEGFAALNPGLKVTETRCEFEQSILSALGAFPPSTHDGITIQAPKLYHFFRSIHTQIQSDLPSSTTLKIYLLKHSLTQPQCSRLGQSLGIWLRKFHAWGAAPEQDRVREQMRANSAMRDLKFWLNYGSNITAMIDKFPEILAPSRDVFESVGNEVQGILDRGEGTLTHGDFWSGNVLLADAELPEPRQPLTMYVVDWEVTHITSTAFDLGQMVGDLFESRHFKNLEAAERLIEAFMEGYGPLDESTAFRTAIQVGVHLICWGPNPPKGTPEQVKAVLAIGRDFVVRAWKKDREFFDGTVLKYLFS